MKFIAILHFIIDALVISSMDKLSWSILLIHIEDFF